MKAGDVVFTNETITRMAEEAAKRTAQSDPSKARRVLAKEEPEELIIRGVVASMEQSK